MRTDVVVQNVASFRIDPAVLTRPDRDTVLVVSPLQHEKLRDRGRVDAFTAVVRCKDFSPEGLAAVVETVRAGATDPADVHLLCHDEYSLAVVAEVRERLDLPGARPPALAAFADKLTMKQMLTGTGVRMPAHTAWDHTAYETDPEGYLDLVEAAVGLPALVKPIDESGAVGVAKLPDRAALRQWAATAPEGRWEVDEFVTGTLYHVDSLVVGGTTLFAAVNQDLHPCADYAEGRLNASWTIPETDPVHDRLLEFNELVLASLPKPMNGVFHHEVFRTPADELVFLEIAARPPAALIPATSQIRFGVNVEEAHFRLQRGEQVQIGHQRGPFAGYAFVPKRAGRLVARRRPELLSDHRWVWNVQVGEPMEAPENIRDFAASVLLWNNDVDALTRDLRTLDTWTALVTDHDLADPDDTCGAEDTGGTDRLAVTVVSAGREVA